MISTPLQQYIHISKYARYLDDKGRRETWQETVERYVNYWESKYPDLVIGDIKAEMLNTIYCLEAMPSMRALMTAGKALDRDNAAGFNCSGAAINHPRVFDEGFYLLMCGSGFGFSVERQFINQMPEVAEEFYESDTTITVADSKIGWASALRELISLLYAGKIPKFDFSKVRPAGARLKTFGGRASGYKALELLFKQTVRIFRNAPGRRLNSLECHDLMCHIAEAVIVGSVRRSAMISFSNLTDDRMRRAKTGDWWTTDPQRGLANNSVMYTEYPDLESFIKEMKNLYKSKAGERGLVNQEALYTKAVTQCGRNPDEYYILNPCAEAILPATGGLCNLTEVVVRPEDTVDTLARKVKYATIFGTLQSTLTNFRYLRKVWQKNAEEERLLGVSLTGVMDHIILSGRGPDGPSTLKDILTALTNVARETNKEWAKKLGINPSKQLTLVKPSGTVSLLCDSSSGIHPRYAKYYIRRVTQDIKDPLTQLMVQEGVPHINQGEKVLFEFLCKAPDGAVIQGGMSALEQLELWLMYYDHWCEGNPSQTIYYTDREFLDVCAWVYKNFDKIGGLSFFPVSDHIYKNAPLEAISEEDYNRLLSEFPTHIDWSKLSEFEKEDTTTSSQEFACQGGQCEY